MKNKIFLTLLCAVLTVYGATKTDKIPPLVLVIVVDQFAYHELQKLSEHFTGGISFMHKNGVVFENAYQPHGTPQTAVGHTSLNTGVLPKYHGIIGNEWLNKEGKLVNSDDDTPQRAAVFKRDGTLYSYGKSAENIMVDSLSDQVMLRNSPQRRHTAVCLSLKSRAAIGMAGHMGLPIWLDDETGWFTTSKAFASTVPAWVQKFNRMHRVDTWKEVQWTLAYPEKSPAYNYSNINNYTFAGSWGYKGNANRIAGTKILLEQTTDGAGTRGCFECLEKTPEGNHLLTDLAIATIDEFADHQKPDHFCCGSR